MEREFLPQGTEVGVSGVHYRTWAPTCRQLDLQVMDDSGTVLRQVPMARGGDGFFHGCDDAGRAGDLYKYRLNGDASFPDPASRFQPKGVHGPSMVVDPSAYQWHDESWQRLPFRDLVIYELHIGTFTPEGTFRSAIERLQHVQDLGSNCIEIMPVADFPGDRNWGYDGVMWYAPARAYGNPDDLRALVDAAHRLGLAVILDVVYNHLGPDGNYLGAYIGEYLDEETKTPWGGAIRYGDPAFKPLRDLVLANPGYWMREFHIDGFRLDATHAIVDESPKHLLAELAQSIHERGGYAIAEDSRNEAAMLEPVEQGGLGFNGVWADDFHHAVRVSNTGEKEGYLGDFTGSLDEVVQAVGQGWLYCGQARPTSGTPRGTKGDHLPPESFVHCISNHDQVGNRAFGTRLHDSISAEAYRVASALLCLGPGTPMLFQGQEWAASAPFLFFTDHEHELGKLITQGRREEFSDFADFSDPAKLAQIPDPQDAKSFTVSKLDWGEIGQRPGLLALYRECLKLRLRESAFRPVDRESWQAGALTCGVGALRYRNPGGDWLILFDLLGGHTGDAKNDPICSAPAGQSWKTVIFTEDQTYGGSGASGVKAATLEVNFTQPELVVLRAS